MQRMSEGVFRVVRITLDASGTRATAITLLDKDVAMTAPGAAAITGDTLYYLSDRRRGLDVDDREACPAAVRLALCRVHGGDGATRNELQKRRRGDTEAKSISMAGGWSPGPPMPPLRGGRSIDTPRTQAAARAISSLRPRGVE